MDDQRVDRKGRVITMLPKRIRDWLILAAVLARAMCAGKWIGYYMGQVAVWISSQRF